MADADLQLFSSTKERRRYTDLADFYAIIKATEHLEKAYARDAIDEARYEKACLKLISQFKSSESALKLGGGIEDASSFIAEWKMDCPRARDRLVRCGAPATVLHATEYDVCERCFVDFAVDGRSDGALPQTRRVGAR